MSELERAMSKLDAIKALWAGDRALVDGLKEVQKHLKNAKAQCQKAE